VSAAAGYEKSGVSCVMMRGGTSRGLYFLADDLPMDESARDDLLLRLMGTPDPRQIDGLGGATSLTSKVAVVSASASSEADVDYLFLQVGVGEPTVSQAQTCGNILAGVGPFAVERGLVRAQDPETTVRIRILNGGGVSTAVVPTPGGKVEYRGSESVSGVPGTAAGIAMVFEGNTGATTGALLPTGKVSEVVDGVEVTLVDSGMPVVVALASSFGLSGHESHAALAADRELQTRVNRVRLEAGRLMGLGDVSEQPVPKTVLVAPASGHDAHLSVRSFIPVQPHTAMGVLAAVSTVAGALVPGSVAHHLTTHWDRDRPVALEHPSGRLVVEVRMDLRTDPPTVERAAVVRTARKLFDGTAYPREHR
jgi:4-oxalomesaconate tautomerase